MSWRQAFLNRYGVGVFAGITLGRWLRVLRENRFAIDRPYWLRAVTITLASIPNSVIGHWEKMAFGRKVANTRIEAPLFILGIWRSGTTHLHNLFARDDRFCYPNLYQIVYPHTFLTTEKTQARLLGIFLPHKRPQDDMLLGIREPQEDEYALCSLIGSSLLLSLVFPRRTEHYDRYLTLRGLSADELAAWKSALTSFLKKLSLKYGRPLVLKSPGHTARIRLLLDMFPDAKFIHIHRNPYEVFQSTRHAVLKVAPSFALQRPDYSDLDDRTIRQYKETYEAFFQERNLIPKDCFHEIGFAQLASDPVGIMRRVYKALQLPDFSKVEPDLQRYVDSLSSYQRNVFPDLPAHLRQRIAGEWHRSFEVWGYPV